MDQQQLKSFEETCEKMQAVILARIDGLSHELGMLQMNARRPETGNEQPEAAVTDAIGHSKSNAHSTPLPVCLRPEEDLRMEVPDQSSLEAALVCLRTKDTLSMDVPEQISLAALQQSPKDVRIMTPFFLPPAAQQSSPKLTRQNQGSPFPSSAH